MTLGIPITRALRVNARALLAAFALAVIAFVPGTAAAQRSASELETLVAPIALYPDPLLAQLLPASTYPDQVAEAAAYVAQRGADGVDAQGWDASVAATARYTEAIRLLESDPAWTAELGTAFLDQTTGVMEAIQQMRSRARASGALQDTPQQKVVLEEEFVRIVPAEPEVIYVPQYDPQVVYVQSSPQQIEIEVDDDDIDWDDAVVAGAIGFGAGVAMGAWLDMDCDWGGHSMYYHGWSGGGGSYWHGGNYANFTRNTNVNVDRPVWNNPNRPGGSGNRPGSRPGQPGNRPGSRPDRPADGAGNRPDRPGRPSTLPADRPNRGPGSPGAGRPGADARPGTRPGDRQPGPGTLPARPGNSGTADRARPSTQPMTPRDQELARKREKAQQEMRGKMPATSDRRGSGDLGKRDDRARESTRDARADRTSRDARANGDRSRADRDRSQSADRQRNAFDQYQRGSETRRASERGASSRKSSTFDRGSFGGGGGRSSTPKASRPGGGGRSGGGGRRGGRRG